MKYEAMQQNTTAKISNRVVVSIVTFTVLLVVSVVSPIVPGFYKVIN